MPSEEKMYQTIGQNIFYYRLKERLSVEDLSERIAKNQEVTIPVSELQEFELGTAIFEIGALLTIAEALRIHPATLLRNHSFFNFLMDFGKEQIQACFLFEERTSDYKS